jgi:hypothetical protein
MVNEEIKKYQSISREDIMHKANEIFVASKPSILFYKSLNGQA